MDLPPDLTLSVLEGPGEHPFVPVRKIGWGQVRVDFPPEGSPVLLIGQTVELGFRGPGIQGLARVRGFVSQRVDDENGRTYAFQLDHGDGTALDAAVNRRATPRVTPDASAPVRVVLRDGKEGVAVATLLRDLSEGGLSVLLGREQEWLLAHAESLAIEMRLPGVSELQRMTGRVRHRRLERTAIHYGISFDEPQSGSGEHHEALQAYIAERRRAMQAQLGPGVDAA